MRLGEMPPETRTFRCGHQETRGGSYWMLYTGDFARCEECRKAANARRVIDHNAAAFALLRSMHV